LQLPDNQSYLRRKGQIATTQVGAKQAEMALSDNLRGSLLMVVAMIAFTVNDACMKAVTADFPSFEAIAIRGTLTTLALCVIALRNGAFRLPVPKPDRRWISWRVTMEVASTLTFILALKHMPLANLSAILQFLPLGVTLAAALVLGDKIGWRRMSAITIGFLGVMLIIRPGGDGFDRWSVLGIISMLCVIVRDLSTRRISREVPSTLVAVLAALSVTVSAIVFLPFTEFAIPTVRQALLTLMAATFLIVGYLTVISAMRVGDIAVVAPFRYTSLVAAIILGWVAFGQFPDNYTLIGSAIVVATGIYTFQRERRLSRIAQNPA
jgi:drug/metabolite transporter (DMT)-like permease